MFIRRTQTRSSAPARRIAPSASCAPSGSAQKVRQRTLLNLGRHFPVGQSAWPVLCRRIDEVLTGQLNSTPIAPRNSKRTPSASPPNSSPASAPAPPRRPTNTISNASTSIRSNSCAPRSVGVEHVALWAMDQLGLRTLFEELGIGASLRAAAIGSIVARMARPGSERATRRWLGERSALGELLEVDFETMGPMQLYPRLDALMAHREAIEHHLFDRAMGLYRPPSHHRTL